MNNTFILEYKGKTVTVEGFGFLDAIGRNFPGACGAKRTKVISMGQKERWSVDFGPRDFTMVTIKRADFGG